MHLRAILFKFNVLIAILTGLSCLTHGGVVRLAWEPAPGQVQGYNVYRAVGEQPLQVVNSAPLQTPVFEDRSVNVGVLYYYSVTSVGSNGQESDFSNRVAAIAGGEARLEVAVDSPEQTLIGTTASFDVTVRNRGTAPNGSILEVAFRVPSDLEWEGWNGGDWFCTSRSGRVQCSSEVSILPYGLSRLSLHFTPQPGMQQKATVEVDLSTAKGLVQRLTKPVGKILYGFYAPYQFASEDGFVGVALANHSDQTAGLDLSVFDRSGSTLETADEEILLRPGAQHVELSYERAAGQGMDPGWLGLLTENPGVGGSFQFGDRQLYRLDGGRLCAAPQRDLLFSRVRVGQATFNGQPVETTLEIVNPADGEVTLEAELVLMTPSVAPGAPAPVEARHNTSLLLGAKELLQFRPEEVFGEMPDGVGYIRVRTVEGTGVIGFQRIDYAAGASTVGLGAEIPDGTVLYAPQVARGRDVFTNLKLINSSAESRSLELLLTGDSGQSLAPSVTLQLGAGEALEANLDQIFDLSGLDLVNGSLEVRADGPGLTGNVVLGDPTSLEFAASLPLEVHPRVRLAFDYFASTREFFTGLAITNTTAEDAIITLEALDREGSVIAHTQFDLGPRHMLSRTLAELLPEVKGRVGGYVRLESSRPVIAQQVFGHKDLRFLSAVLAQQLP